MFYPKLTFGSDHQQHKRFYYIIFRWKILTTHL